MTTTAKEVLAKMVQQREAATAGLIAKINNAKSMADLESVLTEDDAETLVYANATPADQQKIDSAVEACASALAM
jgi:hypothetical protein